MTIPQLIKDSYHVPNSFILQAKYLHFFHIHSQKVIQNQRVFWANWRTYMARQRAWNKMPWWGLSSAELRCYKPAFTVNIELLLFSTTKKKGKIPFITQHKLLHYLAVVSIKTKSYVITTVRFLHMIFRNMWDITQSPNNVWEANIIPTHRKKCETQRLNDSVKFAQLRNRNKPRNTESSSCTFHYISYNTFLNVLHDLYSIFYNKIVHTVT